MPDNATCSVQAMVPTTVGVQVQVNCFNSAGMLADEPFDLLITNSRSPRAGVFDFAEFNRDGALVQALSFNSAGKQNSAVRTGIGVYGVTMPGSGSAGSARGTVKVSAASDVAVSCQIGAWSATKTAQKITVRCFSPSGTPQDTPFFVSYARGTNLMGRDGLIDANASVLGHESHPVYQPAVQFDSTRNARITVAHTDPGSYLVFFAGSGPTAQANGGAGNIQVTPIGAQYRRCGYTLLRKTVPELQVTCADAAGHPRNTPFTVQWVVNP
jgi:hypothetical protein